MRRSGPGKNGNKLQHLVKYDENYFKKNNRTVSAGKPIVLE